MPENYEPKPHEIFTFLWQEFGNLFRKENVSRTGKSLKQFGFFGVSMFGIVITAPYYIPTAIREAIHINAGKYPSGKYSLAQNLGGWTGLLGGITADIGQVLGYSYLSSHEHPEVIAIPLATNAFSGIYELSRKAYRYGRQRLIEKHGMDNPNALSESTR